MTTLATFDVLIRGDVRQFEHAVGSAMRTGQGFLRNVTSIATGFIVAEVAMRGFNMAVAAGKDALIGYNARMEQAQIAFKTLMKDERMALSFIEDLKKFAAVTPFDFPGLQNSANMMMAMGFAAQDVIPTLTAVGDVMAAMGRSGAEGSQYVQRIVYNLGQMKQMGRVTNRELRDLAMLGVPVYKILAKEFGVSVGEMQQMINKGVIPADQAIQALIKGIEEGDMGGMMAEQAKTFNGAMSTIKDTFQDLTGTALKPAFEAIRDVVYAISLWIQSEKAAELAKTIAQHVRTLVIILQNAAPAIQAFARGILDALGRGVESIRNWITQTKNLVTNAATGMYDGGWNAIVAYAQGMIDAAKTWVAAAVDYITEYVSARLIGASPPPVGPLSKIFEGGKATMQAWVDGALAVDLTPIDSLPKRVAAALDDYKKALERVNATIGGIDDQLSLIDLNMSQLQLAASRMTYEYQTQLRVLQDQLRVLYDTYSFADKKRDLELSLKKNLLEQQLIAAKGDWWAQAQIQSQLDQVNAQIEQNRLLEEQESLEAQIAGLPLEEEASKLTKQYEDQIRPIQDQLTLLEQQRQELQYQRQVWQLIAEQINTAATALKQAASASKAGRGAAGKAKPSFPDIPETKHDVPINEQLFLDNEEIEKRAQAAAEGFINGFNNWLMNRWPAALGAIIGAAIGFAVGGPGGAAIGATIGSLIGNIFETPIKNLADDLAEWVSGMLSDGFGDGIGGFSFETLVQNVADGLQGIFDWIVNTGVPKLGEALGPMALQFVRWVGDVARVVLENLPTVVTAIWEFISTNVPVLMEKLGEWTTSFTGWILTDLIPELVRNLILVGEAIVRFIVETTPTIVQNMVKLAVGLVNAFVNNVTSLPGKLWGFLQQMAGKLLQIVGPFAVNALSAAQSLVKSLMDEVGKLPGKIWDTLMSVIGKVAEFVPKGVTAFTNLAGKLGKAFANSIVDLIEGAVNAMIRAVNSFKLPAFEIDLGPLGKQRFGGWGGLNLPYIKLPRFAQGAWDLPSDLVAVLHKGEMVLPADISNKVRRSFDGGLNGVVVNGPLINIENFRGTDSEVNDLMDRMALELRLATR